MPDRRRRPRWLARLRARFRGEWWLPCPICGQPFGASEGAGYLLVAPGRGRIICPNCPEEAERRNRANASRFSPPRYPLTAGGRVVLEPFDLDPGEAVFFDIEAPLPGPPQADA